MNLWKSGVQLVIKDLLDALGKIKSRHLLIVFAALSISTFAPGGGPIANPFSAISFMLPFLVIAAYVIVISWVLFVHQLNSGLADHDLASWGPVIGGTLLAFCLSVTFWYVSNVPDPINVKLLGTSGFTRMFALYLFAIETININR
ncbi:hypothetical protein KJF94_18805 [Pseudomonas hormoni]|uniref:Uncharacterized protein n=1 Tax=Pseudomonas hormoni TaxID=3093767 RepID=A0ABX8EQH4_9PSED|nr:hypothetical protein [Pseudomonas hormoni]QVW21929.1 hypothetical protein KJF94_18805 [Pseudomonas hormoni]